MALETATNISQLVETNPAATDGLSQADDHIRMIKAALKATFPNITGSALITHTELNHLSGGIAAQSVSLATNDAFVVNDGGTMKQVPLLELINFMANNLPVSSTMITDGTIQTADLANGIITAAKLASDVGTPAGVISPYAGTSAPTGWLMCFGQDVSRTIEANLYTAIGENFGSGDGSTTFNVPDLRGRVIAGTDNMGGISANRLTSPLNGDTFGATGGNETHTLTTAELPAHNHSGTVDLRTNWEAGTSSLSPIGTGSARYDGTASKPSLDIANTGGGAAHANVQPTMILNYIIKT